MKLGITKSDLAGLDPAARTMLAQQLRKAGHDREQLAALFGEIAVDTLTPEEGNARAKAAFQNPSFTATTHYGRQV